jgi:hypothetical protein
MRTGGMRQPFCTAARWFTSILGVREIAMQDLVMLFFTGIFFALAFLYVKACQKLR